MCEFQFVALRVCKSSSAPFSLFNLIRIATDVAVPRADKMRRKLDLEVELNVRCKQARWPIRGER